MGWTFLVVSINGAAYTISAFKPPTRNKLLFGWGFFASWVTIELAPFHLIWQIFATAMFARRGAMRSTAGRIGMGITIASWIGLLDSIRRSYSARNEIRDALRNLDYTDDAREPLAIHTRRNIPYARVSAHTLRLDVVAPVDKPAPGERRPALVQVHGGGWVLGFKDRQGQLLMRQLAKRGWVCFNIDYRLSPMATFPDHLVDVKRAIAWVRDHADEYDIDPDFVAVSGGSAGGHLTALAALTANDPRYQEGFVDSDTSVQAAVPFYGVYDFTNRNITSTPEEMQYFIAPLVMKADLEENPEAYAAASPLDQVHEDAPPFLVVHGDIDVLAPVEDARDFVGRLETVSKQPVYYLELHGAQHAFETFASIRANAVIEAAARFLDSVWSAHQEVCSNGGPSGAQVSSAVREAMGDEAVELMT